MAWPRRSIDIGGPGPAPGAARPAAAPPSRLPLDTKRDARAFPFWAAVPKTDLRLSQLGRWPNTRAHGHGGGPQGRRCRPNRPLHPVITGPLVMASSCHLSTSPGRVARSADKRMAAAISAGASVAKAGS